jgi:hypothetical protein
MAPIGAQVKQMIQQVGALEEEDKEKDAPVCQALSSC